MSAPVAWKGRWLLAVAALHLAACLTLAHAPLQALWLRGPVGGMGHDAGTDAALWSLLFGAALALLGLAVHALERAGAAPPRALGCGLLGLALAGAALMPASGFWLALPPAVALLRRQRGLGEEIS